jgi:hypothetical protein
MAALPQIDVEQTEPKPTLDEAASELYKIVEGHFDSLGLSEEERDQRYISAREFLDAKDAANATA